MSKKKEGKGKKTKKKKRKIQREKEKKLAYNPAITSGGIWLCKLREFGSFQGVKPQSIFDYVLDPNFRVGVCRMVINPRATGR